MSNPLNHVVPVQWRYQKYGRIQGADHKIMLVEVYYNSCWGVNWPWNNTHPWGPWQRRVMVPLGAMWIWTPTGCVATNRHASGFNCNFADGHVEFVVPGNASNSAWFNPSAGDMAKVDYYWKPDLP